MRTFIIKNDSGTPKTYLGKVLQDQDTYELTSITEVETLRKDEAFITDINSQEMIINNGESDIGTVASALNYLYRDDLNSIEIDSDKRQIIRSATTYKGWRYLAHPIEVTLGKLNGMFSRGWLGVSRGDCSMKFYNDQNIELVQGANDDATFQATLDSDCVKTIVDLCPSYDYDIIGGNVHQHTTPTQDVRLWVVAGAADLAHLDPNAVKEFVGGLNFKFFTPGDKVETDGRASARLNAVTTGVPVPTNKMRYIFTHPAGLQHDIMIVVEYFRQ